MLVISDRTNRTVIETIKGQSSGSANSLSVLEPYYYGGIPDDQKQQLPIKQIGLIVTEPFIGCMSDFKISQSMIRDRLKKIELMTCANNHESGTFFTGETLTSHASLPNFINLNDAYEISFEFKSRTQNGVVLYIGSRVTGSSDYALLELVNGVLNYKFKKAGVENIVKFTPKFHRNELCNSNWVRVLLKKEVNGHISLQLKGIDASGSFAEDLRVENELLSDVYIGALPIRGQYADITQTNEPFVGCMRDLTIMKSNNNYNGKVLLQMNLQEGVLNYCPLR